MNRTHFRAIVGTSLLTAGLLATTAAAQTGAILVLEGTPSGSVRTVEGGGAVAAVVTETVTGTFPKKHVATVTYEPITLQIGPGSKLMNDWLVATAQGQHARKSGSIVITDSYSTPVSQTDFVNGIITEVTLPTLDAALSSPVFIKVKIQPEHTRRVAPTTGSLKSELLRSSQLASNLFRFEIDGLDGKRISRIESLTIRQPVVQAAVGEARDYEQKPGVLEFSNVLLTMAETSARDWIAWHDDFVIRGNNTDDKEKRFSLYFMNAAGAPAMTITGHNVGILAVRPLPMTGGESIRRVQVELYVERMELAIP